MGLILELKQGMFRKRHQFCSTGIGPPMSVPFGELLIAPQPSFCLNHAYFNVQELSAFSPIAVIGSHSIKKSMGVHAKERDKHQTVEDRTRGRIDQAKKRLSSKQNHETQDGASKSFGQETKSR